MTPEQLQKIAENSGWSDPTRIAVVNLIELWKVAKRVNDSLDNHELIRNHSYEHEDLGKALQNLEETK